MKKRVISAIIALIIVLPLIIAGGVWFKIGVYIIGLLGLYEMINVISKDKKIPMVVRVLSMIVYILLIDRISANNTFDIPFVWFILPVIVTLVPALFYKSDKYNIVSGLMLLGSIYLLGIGFGGLVFIRNINVNYFMYLIINTIMCDTFAHFFGTQIGKYKLCPSISPNKTIEGFIGGVVFATFISSAYFTTFYSQMCLLSVILISFIISLFAVCGDLIFSLIKRCFGVKDYGHIMPGHGGVLDRVDSVLIAGLALLIIIYIL